MSATNGNKLGLAGAALLLVASGSCSQPDSDESITDRHASARLFEMLAASAAGGSSISIADNIADFLPGQLVSYDGSAPEPLADGVVHGSVIEASVGFASAVATGSDGEELPAGTQVPADSVDADWREITVTLAVKDAWGAKVANLKTIQFMIPISGTEDPSLVIQGLEALDNVVAVLDDQGSVSSGEDLFRVAMEDRAIGVVDGSGLLSFPALEDAEESKFLGHIHSIDEIRKFAPVKQPIIQVEGFSVVSR